MDAAYEVDDDVYFDVSKAKTRPAFKKTSGQSGARWITKRNPWILPCGKRAKKRANPRGRARGMGRPGWHIECSVMSKPSWETIDIHAGGADLQFPHHEMKSPSRNPDRTNQILMHNAMITMEDVKMSKSLGNIRTVRELKQEYDPEALRFWLLSAHYRSRSIFGDAMAIPNGLERCIRQKPPEPLTGTSRDTGEKSLRPNGFCGPSTKQWKTI